MFHLHFGLLVVEVFELGEQLVVFETWKNLNQMMIFVKVELQVLFITLLITIPF